MRICIDARWIFPELSGIGVYTRELIRELSRLDQRNQYVCLFSDKDILARTCEETALESNPNWSAARIAHGVFSPLGQVTMPRWLKRNQIDLFHSPNWMVPLAAFPTGRRGRTACVVTVHDLIPLLFPDNAPRSKKRRLFPLYRALMRSMAARADKIIAVSKSSASDIVEHLPAPLENVQAVYNGVSDIFRHGSLPREPVILYVGRLDPYKNVPLLIEAFAQVREQLTPDARLEIIGPPDERYPEAGATIDRLGLRHAVVQRSYVSDAELLSSYQRARMLALPSSYEGFGLPVVEAMACGTPVVCSRASSLPEVAGDVGILFEPGNRQSLAEAILSAWHRPPPADSLQDQAAGFSWGQTAAEVLRVYESFTAS